ncbi:MAG: pilus assembly protein TadG-related protein [Anaerolineae bacterium]
MMFQESNERGQSAVIIAFVVIVLLALVALVVDIGNAYAHRRIVQNACDAAALAGARKLAEDRPPDNRVVYVEVLDEIQEYAEANGVDQEAIVAWFIDAAGARGSEILPWDVPVPAGARGVEVVGDLPFRTYFAHLLGFDTMQASTNAMVWVLNGPCEQSNLLPITMKVAEEGEEFKTGQVYTLWDHDNKEIPGNFGWIYWVDGDGKNHCHTQVYSGCVQGPQTTVLEPNIVDTSQSGTWHTGEWVQGDVGVNMQPVLGELERYVKGDEDDPWPTVYIPLYNDFSGTGNNALYHISGFAAFQLTCVFNAKNQLIERNEGDCDQCYLDGSSDGKCIRGQFVKDFSSVAVQDGCQDTGITFLSFRRPRSQ